MPGGCCGNSRIETLSPSNRLLLLVRNTQELHHIGLKERNPKGEIDTHDPELGRAQEVAIGRVGEEYLDQVYMKEAGGRNSEGNITHPDDWRVSMAEHS